MRRLGILLATMAVSAIPSLAQQPPDLDQGMKAYGAYQHGDIDSVNLANGNVTLHIPLVSYPQRGGKLKLGYEIIYNNKGWYQYQTGTYTYAWRYGGGAVSIVAVPGMSVKQSIIKVTDYSGSQYLLHHYTVTTADGSTHDVGITNNPQYGLLGTGETIDGTGIHYGGSVLIDRNGIQYPGLAGLSGSSITDPNGNQLTSGSDTIGRVIPTSTSTDTTNCPSGTASAFASNYPAYNGATAVLKVCYANYTYHNVAVQLQSLS